MNVPAAVADARRLRGHAQEDAEEGLTPLLPYFSRGGSYSYIRGGNINHERNLLIVRVVPLSLVPISTANAMLVVSARLHSGQDCFFPLPEYLVATGALSLGLVVMGVMARHVLDWVLKSGKSHAGLVKLLEVTGDMMALAQALLLFGGTFLLASQLWKVNTSDRSSPFYCDHQLVMFSTVFLFTSWIFLTFALVAYVYIGFWGSGFNYRCCRRRKSPKSKIVGENV